VQIFFILSVLNPGPEVLQNVVLSCLREAGCGIWHVWSGREVYSGIWWGNLRIRDYLESLDIYGGIILKCILKKY
jgi:hypothetical protein